jgi:hypothetical protein
MDVEVRFARIAGVADAGDPLTRGEHVADLHLDASFWQVGALDRHAVAQRRRRDCRPDCSDLFPGAEVRQAVVPIHQLTVTGAEHARRRRRKRAGSWGRMPDAREPAALMATMSIA